MDEGRCKTRHGLKEVEHLTKSFVREGPIISGSEGWSLSKLISQTQSLLPLIDRKTTFLFGKAS